MRVLQGGGGLVDRDLVAADFARQRGPFRLAREEVESGLRASATQRSQKRQKQVAVEFHCRCLSLEFVRAVRAETEHVLDEYLVVDQADLRAVLIELKPDAAELGRVPVDHGGIA